MNRLGERTALFFIGAALSLAMAIMLLGVLVND